MEEKKIFSDENSKEEFKRLCVAILPQIKAIMRIIKEKGINENTSISMGKDGFLNFYVYGSRWEMTRSCADDAFKIRYGYSEEIEALESREMEYNKVSENLVEISLVFASLQAEHKELSDIDSITWKQMFVEWANEFELEHPEPEHWEDNDYLECIEKFARRKILEYAHLEMDFEKVVV